MHGRMRHFNRVLNTDTGILDLLDLYLVSSGQGHCIFSLSVGVGSHVLYKDRGVTSQSVLHHITSNTNTQSSNDLNNSNTSVYTMATDSSLPQANGAIDLAALVHIRPAEIKTYHRDTYNRISPSKTFDGKNKTVLITGGGSFEDRMIM